MRERSGRIRIPRTTPADPGDSAVRFAVWTCVTFGAGLAFFGAGLAHGGDAFGGVLAVAGMLVGGGGVAGAVVLERSGRSERSSGGGRV